MDPRYIDSLLPANLDPTLQLLVFFVLVAFLPLLLLTTTPFLRIVIVMFMMRGALGIQSSPPNLIITSLSIILTIFVMQGALTDINKSAIIPLAEKKITMGQAISISSYPLRQHMLEQTEEKDLILMYELTGKPLPSTREEISFIPLVAAHVISELRVAFSLGFLMYIPFLVVDLIVANVLLALGMMMLSPTIISLPFKLMVFVAVDGWALLIKGLVKSFGTG